MDDMTRKRIERHRIGSAKVPPGVMQFVRDQATAQIARELLKRHDAGELDAAGVVEVLRGWLTPG